MPPVLRNIETLLAEESAIPLPTGPAGLRIVDRFEPNTYHYGPIG